MALQMAPLIDKKLANIDRQHNMLANIDIAMRDVLASYDQAVQQVQIPQMPPMYNGFSQQGYGMPGVAQQMSQQPSHIPSQTSFGQQAIPGLPPQLNQHTSQYPSQNFPQQMGNQMPPNVMPYGNYPQQMFNSQQYGAIPGNSTPQFPQQQMYNNFPQPGYNTSNIPPQHFGHPSMQQFQQPAAAPSPVPQQVPATNLVHPRQQQQSIMNESPSIQGTETTSQNNYPLQNQNAGNQGHSVVQEVAHSSPIPQPQPIISAAATPMQQQQPQQSAPTAHFVHPQQQQQQTNLNEASQPTAAPSQNDRTNQAGGNQSNMVTQEVNHSSPLPQQQSHQPVITAAATPIQPQQQMMPAAHFVHPQQQLQQSNLNESPSIQEIEKAPQSEHSSLPNEDVGNQVHQQQQSQQPIISAAATPMQQQQPQQSMPTAHFVHPQQQQQTDLSESASEVAREDETPLNEQTFVTI
jgi:hypothetical protein